LRETAVRKEAQRSEKWLQKTSPEHIERAKRLANYWKSKLLAEAVEELLKLFPPGTDEALVIALAPQSTRYQASADLPGVQRGSAPTLTTRATASVTSNVVHAEAVPLSAEAVDDLGKGDWLIMGGISSPIELVPKR
jgi:hypothetical protein